MTSWNYATLFEAIAEVQPDVPALLHGERTISWGQFEERTRALGAWLWDQGAVHQDKVALYLYNAPEYLETAVAAFRVGLVPVNTNYRYGREELLYLWENADAIAVVFHGAFAEMIDSLRDDAVTVRSWVWVDDGSGPCPDWATPYDETLAMLPDRLPEGTKQTPDDLLMMYTGGTTGMPKGVMWSEEVKLGLLEHFPKLLLVDTFGSSEAIGMGSSVTKKGSSKKTGAFSVSDEVKVIDEFDQPITPGSDEIGVLALGGRNPIGYYKDEAKSLATFRIIDGQRFSVPGDFAQVALDGSIQLLGRGSQCINTAGEKVFPEEVEEVLKRHELVVDACVVGVPDPRFGERVVAAVELRDPSAFDEADLISHTKAHLAHYKAPRHIRVVPTIGRAANGKMDYGRHKSEAAEWVSTLNA